MPDDSRQPRSITLSMPPDEQWTLHHVLLDRIEGESTAEDAASVESPPIEVFRAFETLDDGETSFTVAQLEAMQTVLAEYHHSTTWWELERARLEQLLYRITNHVDQDRSALPAE